MGKIILAVVLAILIAGGTAWIVSGNRARQQALLETGRLSGLVEDARAEADRLSELAEASRLAAETAMEELAQQRARADSAASQAEAQVDSLRTEAKRSGAQALIALQAALGAISGDSLTSLAEVETILIGHLRQDALAEIAWQQEVDAQVRATGLADQRATLWRERALSAETALTAREMECRSCAEEVRQWRARADPGLFERLRQNIPLVSGSALGGAILVVLIGR